MNRNRRWYIAAGIIAGLILVIGGPLLATLSDDTKPEPRAPSQDVASTASARFLNQYVDPDGRVVRRDQGNDTVSEGQAYAMLISAAMGDRARFDSSWKWTKDHLGQPNGLFAWRWQNGQVVDPQAATDADMDMARALVVASRHFGESSYADEARKLAKNIADNTMAYAADGKPIVTAGPWARNLPFYVNPSYHSPRTDQELAALTDDTRWPAAALRQRAIIGELIGSGQDPKLPPDWAAVNLDGLVSPATPPSDPAVSPRYSYDAVRLPVRLAESCDAADRAQAAQMWTVLNRSRESKNAPVMALNGDVIDGDASAVATVASAAAAKAAGDQQQSNDLLDAADRSDTAQNTYYGSAWVALGRIMLTTDWLGRCPAN